MAGLAILKKECLEMTMGSNDVVDPTGAMLHRGRMALEALKAREEAARFHAASADLQIALMEAESGNQEFLKRWLMQYRPLIDQEPELQHHLASIQTNFEVAESVSHLVAEKRSTILEDLCQPTAVSELNESPWSAMVTGATRRAALRSDPESELNVKPRRDPENCQSPTADLKDALLVIPTSLQRTLAKDTKPSSTKKWTWLSSSVGGSVVLHLIALVVMSMYMIHLARNPEPKSIVASTTESETISMEAPTEMTTTDDPTLEPSESATPTMPKFEATSAASSSDVQLPTSMAVFEAVGNSLPTNDAVQQATSASNSSSAVANSVQFFGVKAAGNTFCYVVDGSPSMNKDGAFVAAKAELVRSLSLLKPKQRFFIMFFGGEIERIKLDGRAEESYPIYATPENLQKTLQWIDRVRVQKGGLPPNKALLEAIKMDPDGIFLLFDGDTRVDVAEYLRKANRSDDLISGGTPMIQIHTIGFFTQEFEPMMKRIADENRGLYRFVPNPKKR